MKKYIIIAVCAVVVIIAAAILMTFLLKPSPQYIEGNYTNVSKGTGKMLSFDENKISLIYMSAGEEAGRAMGTYTIEGDTITISFTQDEIGISQAFKGALSFEQGDGYILLDNIKYQKQQ